ncbi:MAG: hypothetical protein J6L73_01535 [Muribaculaceae bacterium]|nr:hypothetical protein [Muribaculaceae bacterium]
MMKIRKGFNDNDLVDEILQKFLGSNDEPERESDVGSDDKQKYDIDEIIPFIPKKFENDIFNLKTRIGEENFYRGLTIETSLAEMYEVCPRGRNRADTYNSLIDFLKNELDITLKISNKRYGSITDIAW